MQVKGARGVGEASRSSRTKVTTSSNGSRGSRGSSAGSAAERAAAAAKAKKVAELKELANSVENAGTNLEKTSNYLVDAMYKLKKGLTGASATVINTITDSAQEAMEGITNYLNSTGSRIATDLKKEGEQLAFNKSKVNTEKTANIRNNIFSCDTEVLKEAVLPVLKKAKEQLNNAWDIIKKVPKVDGYEGVSNEAEEIYGVGGFLDNIIRQINDISGMLKKTEMDNEGIISTLGKNFGKLATTMLGGLATEASAAEWGEPNAEQKDNTEVVKGLSTDAARKEKFDAKEEARRKELMAKESSSDVAREDYLATRKFNQEYELQELISNSNLKPKNNGLIAHRGLGAEENTSEAVKNAGEAGCWGCETDVRWDGDKIVCSHDSVDEGETPLSLEEYLKICQEYGMTPILDMKYEDGNNNKNNTLAQEIIKITDSLGMTATTILQTDRINDISNIRGSSENVEIWYLANKGVSSIDTDVIKDNNVGGINIKDATGKNTTNAQQIKDIKDLVGNDVDVCVWNVTTEATKDKILSSGATYVMSDNKLGVTPYQPGDTDFNLVKGNYKNSEKDTSITTESGNVPSKENNADYGETNGKKIWGSLLDNLGTEFHGVEDGLTSFDVVGTINNNKTNEGKITFVDIVSAMKYENTPDIMLSEKTKEILEKVHSNKSGIDNTEPDTKLPFTGTLDINDIDALANYYGIDTTGKTKDEIIAECAKKEGIDTTKIITTPYKYEGEILTHDVAHGELDYIRADGIIARESYCQDSTVRLVKDLKEFEGDKLIDGIPIKDLEYHVRDDGVKCLGDYVLVATLVKSRKGTQGIEDGRGIHEGGIYDYGDPVETTLGRGIIVDYCREAFGEYYTINGEGDIVGTKGEIIRYDIYTAWQDPGWSGKVRADDYVAPNYAGNPELKPDVETIVDKTSEELLEEIEEAISKK